MGKTSVILMYAGGGLMILLGLGLPLLGQKNVLVNIMFAMFGGLLVGQGITRSREIKAMEAAEEAKKKRKKEIHITYRK